MRRTRPGAICFAAALLAVRTVWVCWRGGFSLRIQLDDEPTARVRYSSSFRSNKVTIMTKRDCSKPHKVAQGGAKEIRTPDLFDANEARYQLRHSPGCCVATLSRAVALRTKALSGFRAPPAPGAVPAPGCTSRRRRFLAFAGDASAEGRPGPRLYSNPENPKSPRNPEAPEILATMAVPRSAGSRQARPEELEPPGLDRLDRRNWSDRRDWVDRKCLGPATRPSAGGAECRQGLRGRRPARRQSPLPQTSTGAA